MSKKKKKKDRLIKNLQSVVNLKFLWYNLSVKISNGDNIMLKKKVKIELSDEEQRIILYALNELRTELIQENKYTDVVNEAIGKLKNKMKADRYNLGVIINSLDRKRKNELAKGNDIEQMDYLILRLLKIYETLK